MKIFVSSIVFILLSVFPCTVVSQEISDNQKIKQLENLVPAEPTVIDGSTKVLMQEVAKTQRVDAALILVRCLGFNDDPEWGHPRSAQELIPAIQLLKLHYGKTVAPIIYVEALRSDHPWFRDRAALAVRSMLSQSEIHKMDQLFSLDSNKSANAQAFISSLSSNAPDVELATYSSKTLKEVGRHLEEIHNKKKQ